MVETLIIRKLPGDLYLKLEARAKRERRSVPQEVTSLLAAALASPPALSIMDLQGPWRDALAGSRCRG